MNHGGHGLMGGTLCELSKMMFFSRMRSKGFPFYILGLGVEVCLLAGVLVSATFCNRLQAVATVCKRSQLSASGRNRPRTTVVAESRHAYAKCCKRRDFWIFQVLRSVFSRGRRGTL